MAIDFTTTEKRVDAGAHTYCAVWDALHSCWKLFRWPVGNRHSCLIQALRVDGWQFTMQKRDGPPLTDMAKLNDQQVSMVVEVSKDDPL